MRKHCCVIWNRKGLETKLHTSQKVNKLWRPIQCRLLWNPAMEYDVSAYAAIPQGVNFLNSNIKHIRYSS